MGHLALAERSINRLELVILILAHVLCSQLVSLMAPVISAYRSMIPMDATPAQEEAAAMANHVPVRGLFETHLTVSDLQRSVDFYRDVVGLPLVLEVPERGAAFFWIGARGRAMLG